LLGNGRLALIFACINEFELGIGLTISFKASFRSSDEGSNDIVFRDANVDSCASQFHSYSMDELPGKFSVSSRKFFYGTICRAILRAAVNKSLKKPCA
jgi:hypothetical protein